MNNLSELKSLKFKFGYNSIEDISNLEFIGNSTKLERITLDLRYIFTLFMKTNFNTIILFFRSNQIWNFDPIENINTTRNFNYLSMNLSFIIFYKFLLFIYFFIVTIFKIKLIVLQVINGEMFQIMKTILSGITQKVDALEYVILIIIALSVVMIKINVLNVILLLLLPSNIS